MQFSATQKCYICRHVINKLHIRLDKLTKRRINGHYRPSIDLSLIKTNHPAIVKWGYVFCESIHFVFLLTRCRLPVGMVWTHQLACQCQYLPRLKKWSTKDRNPPSPSSQKSLTVYAGNGLPPEPLGVAGQKSAV